MLRRWRSVNRREMFMSRRWRWLNQRVINNHGQRHAENAGDDELPGTFRRNGPEHPQAVTWKDEVECAFDGQAPANHRHDNRDAVPDVMESDDEGAERKMNESVDEAADLALLADPTEEFHPDERLENMGEAGNEEEGRSEFFD